ncbi:MAG: FliH/SctL family protein [Pirellulales bacterium]
MPSVIKATDPERGIHPVAFNFEDLAQHAERYLEQVRRQAAGLLREAGQQAQAIRQAARIEGRKDAQQELERMARQKVSAELETLLPSLQSVVAQIEQSRDAWLGHWEHSAVHLAAAIAARLVRRELSAHPEITLDLVREALELAAGSGELQIKLNPGDYAALGAEVQRIAAECSRIAPATVKADPSISAGGCRIETRFGSIDQQFEAQLARIEEELS